MGRYGFLTSARWVRMAALTVVVAIACVLLGTWQLERHAERSAEIALVERNGGIAPVPMTDLLPTPDATFDGDLGWRAVEVTGRYLGMPVGLPQRGIEGAAADHALGVLAATVDGRTWLITVDRGWYPTDAFADPSARLQLPGEEVTVVLRMRPAEPASERGIRDGQVFRIAPEQVAEAAFEDDARPDGTLVTGAYGSLESETPTTSDPPTPLGVEAPSYRSNLSYAMQWWAFALLALVAYVVLARREGTTAAGGETPGEVPTESRQPGRRRRASDAEIEDALLDAEGDASSEPRADGADRAQAANRVVDTAAASLRR